MDVPDEGVLDVDSLADDGSDEECEAQPSSDFYAGAASTPTSCASSPRGEEPASPHGAISQTQFFHQTYTRPFFASGRRGPGRPRKEGAKLAREGKIVRRYRGVPGTVRGAKRHRTSRDDALDDMGEDDDFTMPAPEEPPYTPEKWPGKVCALCNLSERSQLGQGEMRQIPCHVEEEGNITPGANSGGFTPSSISGGITPGSITPTTPTPSTPTNMPVGLASPPLDMMDVNLQHALPLSRRQKSFNKCKTPLYNMEHTDELSIIGHLESLELPSMVSLGMIYIHRCCLEFSPPFQDEVASGPDDDKDQLEEARVKGIVTAALSRKCAFCQRHGASIPCKMSCSKYYHLPCVLGSGGLMDFQNKSSFCKDHLYQAPLVGTADVDCRTCRTIGDMSNLMTCVVCGGHYHGTCVGLSQLPGVRAGWSCRSCRVCQVCRGEALGGPESRAVTCEQCDKLYHAMCLRPVMATVPKYGWKCKCCRVCSDCGSRSPGAGPSSRWHAHYTVCDSCYQQRNKGSCCPLCRRAYRAAAYRDMIRCVACRRFVHGMCDPEADPQQYRLKKEQNPTYDYTCPLCKTQMLASKSGSFDEDNMASTSQDSSFGDENSQEQDPLAIEPKTDIGLGKGKPFSVSSKVAKKKIGGFKLKGGFPPAGKIGFQKRQRSVLEFGRKRGSKPKMRGVFGVPGLGLQRPQAPDNKAPEDDPGVENKLVLCSSKDKFVLTQDLCVMCGAIGTDSEGCLIACAQCGQSYHPYCVNIKVSQVIVSLGWRCLDCTVCEGCGSRSDDGLLVLCDDCDTAWHTYCARPQLPEVPRGAWRCERCRRCLVCGTRDTQLWCDNYTECAPCASLVMCCVCSEPYSDGELIIQCVPCSRWLHAACDGVRSEADAEVCCRSGYKCCLCRGRDIPPPHLARAIEAPSKPPGQLTALALGLAGEYYVDDVCLSQRGAHHMKQLEAELGITHTRRKRRFKHENTEKDAVVQNAEGDGDDGKPDTTAEVKEEPGLPANANLKEGILWNVANDGPVPEGFTIYTTDSGLTVLRRKRQRNLNKLGIGGFVVRQRQTTLKAQADEDNDGTQNAESPNNKRKPRRKPRSKLMEQFPSYMQEAFFGKDLLEPKPAAKYSGDENGQRSPELGAFENSDSDGEDVLTALCTYTERHTTSFITLNQDEKEVLCTLKPKEEKEDSFSSITDIKIKTEGAEDCQLKHTEDSTALKNAILGPHHTEMDQGVSTTDGVAPVPPKTEPNTDNASSSQPAISPKDELSLLGVNLDAMVRDTLPDMDSNDVDEIFKGVLTDDSQESQESSVSYVNSMAGTPYSQQRQQLQSPMEYASPYHHTDFGSSGSSALSPLYSESGSGGGSVSGNGAGNWPESSAPPPSYNQRSADKMRADESLGSAATISAVLYANTNHPEWKSEFPNWVDRCKQILKKWRALPAEQKAPYLQRARDNRSAIRMKKAQQDQERACNQQRSAREAEQERQWKQLQQMRQQQTQQQQQIIHDQRIQAAMQRLRTDGSPPSGLPTVLPSGPVNAEAPRSTFPAQRFPLHYANADDNINRQLRDLLQRHPEKMWPPQTGNEEGGTTNIGTEGQAFRLPLPVGVRPRTPLQSMHRPDHHLIMQQRLIATEGNQQGISNVNQQNMEQKQNAPSQSGGDKPDGADQGSDEMDIGDMDKLEQDSGNIGEVDILTGLGGEDDEQLLESLTAEIGEQFNILEYADPELAALHAADHLLDSLDLPDDHHHASNAGQGAGRRTDIEQKSDKKMSSELQTVKLETKSEIKSEVVEVKSEVVEMKTEVQSQFQDGVQRVITQSQHIALQSAMQAIKAEVKPESEETKSESDWQRPVFSQMFGVQQQQQRQIQGARPLLVDGARPQLQFSSHPMHFAQGNSGVTSASAASIVSAMTAQVQAALAAGRSIAPGTKLLGADGAVGVVRHDRSVLLTALPHSARAAPPPYPGVRPTGSAPSTPAPLQHQHQPISQHHQPPPPYPQQMAYEMCEAWPDWLPRRPLLLQEQPLLLEELLEQEKREQEREGGEWGASALGAAATQAPPPAPAPLYSGVPPPAPPPPPERPVSEADHHARLLYEQWLKNYNAYAADQLRYYEAEVQKLRKIRKSLNSKQRQLRKSGNELMPNDAQELQRVSTEQSALQKHLEAARKQARQHSMLVQEYETKQRQNNPQLTQQTVINQQQVTANQNNFNQNQNMGQSQQIQQQTINRPMQIGLQGSGMQQQQQTLIRTQQTLLTADGQPLQQQRIGLVTSPLNAQGRILQGARTLVIEQTGAPQQQLVRQLSGVQDRAQSVGGIVFGQQQLRNQMNPGSQTPRPAGSRPAMSPLHVQSPHSQSPLHSIAPQSPLHHLTSPMQSPLHSQQSPLHHTSQSPLHSSTQSPLHTQQSPMHSQQSPMHAQSGNHPQQSPMHPQQSPMHPQQSPIHQQSPLHAQNQMTAHSPMHPHQSPMHPQQSPMHPQQSPMHQQQSPMHPQPSPMHPQQSPMHPQQSPMHSQQSPMHIQQSPLHTQQSPMQSAMSPQHFLQQLQAQRTSPQLPTPSRSPQIYQQSQIQSPVTSHSPQLQNNDYSSGRFSRPAPGCSPLPTRFARPPHHQQGMRVGVPFGSRQQTSPLGSPQPLPSPGNTSNEMARQQMLQRQQYSPMGGAPASPSVSRSPHVARTPTPSASPAASPAPHHDHGGGHHHHMAPIPPGYRYFKPGLFGGAPGWPPKEEDRRRGHASKISILKRGTPRPRFSGKTAAPEVHQEEGEHSEARKYVLYSTESVDYASTDARMSFSKEDDEIGNLVQHMDDDDIVVVEPGAISPEERIATEEDFEELIDSGKPEDEAEEEIQHEKTPTRTETTTKTVAVISLATAKQPSSSLQQYKLVNTSQNSNLSRLPMLSATVLSPHSNTKILNEVSQATVASVSIANQTISVPVLKNLSVPIGSVGHGGGLTKTQIKKVPLNITNQQLNLSSQQMNKPMSSVISVISSNVPKGSCINPVITLATSNTMTGQSRVPVTIMTQHQVKQKIVKTIEKPMGLSLSNTKLSSLSVTHDATLPAKIFQDDAASPDSTVTAENAQEQQATSTTSQHNIMLSSLSQEITPKEPKHTLKDSNRDIDIENEISQQTELPHTLCLTDRTPLLLGKAEIKSPDPIPEKIPDNIMEGDDEDKPEDNIQSNLLLPFNKANNEHATSSEAKHEDNVVKTIKAIANQTKEMVIGSNMQISSDLAQESVQISIPSPTPSQERYLNDITMREHPETSEGNPKHVESFEDMLCMLDNIGDDGKSFGSKQQPNKQTVQAAMHNPNHPHNNPTPQRVNKEPQEQPTFQAREQERLNMQSATVPQLSPLSQPAEMTSNMASVSQQLRTIMSSLNTNASKVDTQMVTRKVDATPTQVNYENLLPSSKVEVTASRPPPQKIEKSPTSISSSDPLPMSAAQAFGSRVNTLSTLGQMRKSPTVSPINSPSVNMQSNLLKSPAQSPLITTQTITNQGFNSGDDTITTSIQSQIIQMPALSKIQSNLNTSQVLYSHSNNTVTTSISNFQKSQALPTSILGHTLLQPARQINTSNLQFNPQSISSSQPPALVMTSRSIITNKEPAPNVTVRTHNIVNTAINHMQLKQAQGPLNFITSSKLLHTQLTSPLKRSKSTDEPKSEVIVGHIQPTKRHSVESVIVKSEPMETDDHNSTVTTADNSANKTFQQQNANQRNDESQNVLLKQLLQTTTATTSVSVPQRTVTIQRTAPALGTIPSLEAQLARPSIPPPTISLTQEVEIPKNSPRHITSISQPFTSRSLTSIPTSSMSPMMHSSTQSLMDVRKQPVKLLSKEETTPIPECSPTMKTMPMYPMSVESQQLLHQQMIKKEVLPPQQSPVHRPFTPMDVKKELLDESSQQSATSGISTASDQGKLDQPMKEEYPESVIMDHASEINPSETPSEAKKRKRREYQQKKRKQMQMNLKAAAENGISAAAKKRPRKGSRYEEDYDTFIDNLMVQLRLLPPMQIQEPSLTTNFAVCPLFGSGDLTKLKNKDYDILKGDLLGEFGNATIPNVADYYNTKPFGDEEPLPEKPPASTQRGFYDQEFQPILFEEDPEDKKLDFICKERDTDTPDTIVSCSSPEAFEFESDDRFPGLKLIDDDEEEEDEDILAPGRISPIIPIITPIPIRVKPLSLKDDEDGHKQLKSVDAIVKTKMEDSPSNPESNENVTVTLTLTSGAAEDILGVLKELAGILHIPPPTAYQIVERTATPPSHKLGLYRSKGKDGKEGAPIDIQSILNGAAKFCRHCDVVILDSVVRAKASEFPLLAANKGNAEEILCDSDSELYFCSAQCYERFAWRPTNIILDGKKMPVKEDSKSDIETNLSKDRDDFDTASTESMETDEFDIKPDIKDEKMDLSFMDSLDNDELMKEVGDDVSALDEDLKSVDTDEKSNQSVEKEKFKGIRYKLWTPGCIGPPVKYKRPTDRELTELVFRTGVAIMPVTNEDSRKCELCGIQGDGVADGVSRLLNSDVDRWVHLNCALWSEGVYETVSGALMNVDNALAAGSNATCAVCRRLGATVRCFKVRCGSVYHLGCAVKDNCVFYKNKSAFCASHAPKNEKDNELTTLSVQRRVYISRDEQRQVASVMLHSDTNHLIRVGGLIFLSPGHLLPHQLAAFHTPNYIYPIGYKIVRFFWSMNRANSRCRYVCWISEEEGRPKFHVRVQDDSRHEMCAPTPRAAWAKVLDTVAALREGRNEDGVLKLWPNYVTGEDLFGLTEPSVVRVLESLPGIETLTDYRFKFGRSALLEGGLAVNPSGCARSEARCARVWRRNTRSLVPAQPPPATALDSPACPYSKQFVHTKSSQYKKMKMEWRNNVYLARSKIQGLGLYAARDLEKHTMVIEYIGEIIRSELSEIREKQYEARNRGIYMFRLDERRVVDATLCGGLARYINHSCQPNCVAETVEVDRHLRIIIFAKRRISRGEELAYDYKFDIEDDAHKIMCMCGAPNCRKWMN
ncbi:histone-lysine N-methyltransferase 2C-like isoform X11 [Pieris brassicae]|uniref:histone-lysine N-methyltransferase 2C-like isoform X11 n=1 Tax=Pieris brassicae TaxID=7116 RepID=UPI001E6618DB|nr:histone-lysine N-methyltransferase 2C-like isoform X11 [Pieris brassicae]